MTDTQKIDLRPRIFYDQSGRVNGIETYCLVNEVTVASSTYRRNEDGSFSEQHFDEHHGIYDMKPRPTTQERMAILNLRGGVSLLDILNAANSGEVTVLAEKAGLEIRTE
jgi:hypothetical protein